MADKSIAERLRKLRRGCAALRKSKGRPSPLLLAEMEKTAAEASAALAEAKAVDYLSPQAATGQPISSFGERFACGQIAAAMRARK